jgi:hypothetical protein
VGSRNHDLYRITGCRYKPAWSWPTGIIHDGNGVDIFPSAGFDDEGNLNSRAPFMLWNNTAVFDDYLAWQKQPTPFASFFSHWGRAMRRQNWLLAQGCRNAHIAAFSTAGISTIFNPYKVARALGYPNGGFDNRRKLWNHRDEFLVYGAVYFENYAICSTPFANGLFRQ